MACSVCSHPSIATIDATLQRVGNASAVSRLYGLGRQSVNRHRENHLVIRPTLAPVRTPVPVAARGPAYQLGKTPEGLVAEGYDPDLVEIAVEVIDSRDLEFAGFLEEFLGTESPEVVDRFITMAEDFGLVRSDDYQEPDGTWSLRTKPRPVQSMGLIAAESR